MNIYYGLMQPVWPLDWKDWIQIIMCFLVTVLAAPVGIGGGTLMYCCWQCVAVCCIVLHDTPEKISPHP